MDLRRSKPGPRAVAIFVGVALAPYIGFAFRVVPGLEFLGGFLGPLAVSVVIGVVVSLAMIRRQIGYRPIDTWFVFVPYAGWYFLGKFIWRGVHASAGDRYWTPSAAADPLIAR